MMVGAFVSCNGVLDGTRSRDGLPPTTPPMALRAMPCPSHRAPWRR